MTTERPELTQEDVHLAKNELQTEMLNLLVRWRAEYYALLREKEEANASSGTGTSGVDSGGPSGDDPAPEGPG